MPTLLDLLHIEYEPLPTGSPTLAELVSDDTSEGPRPFVVTETCFKDVNRSALLWSDWKLISTYPSGEIRIGEPDAVRRELYRLDRDWVEAHDLAAELPGRVETMSELLRDWQVAHDMKKDEADALDIDVPESVLESLRALGYVK